MNRIRVYWQACVVAMALMAASAGATTIVMPTDEQLIAKSPLIVKGTVVRTTPVDRGGAIWTETALRVESLLKGEAGAEVVIREIGGVLGDRITKIFGAPQYTAGEHVLAFLTPTPRGDYQTTDLFVGKLTEEFTLDDRRLWVRENVDDVTILNGALAPAADRGVQRLANEFERFVADRVKGRRAPIAYEIENAVRGNANFTLIGEPTVYRWSVFDGGGSVNWLSYGTQTGYSGGGVEEVKIAMGAWTGFAGAKIRYVYSGTFTSTPSGHSKINGINEILFDDPLGEIAGSFNRSTGGVVGSGGFNGITGSSNWTGPFVADVQHGNATYRVTNIGEANMVIQDGVTPANGMSSNRLSEIISHEFGHTLGFGHSESTTALMYRSVTGLGPTLRPDDETAASWLYPADGSSVPPPPAVPGAPSTLTGSGSGSNVQLRWTDNASDEIGFYVYMASGNGGFTRAGNVLPNQTAANVGGLPAGSYRFYVTSYNSAGESAASNTVFVALTSTVVPLVASFTYSPSNPLTEDAVNFADRTTGGATAWQWSFGDGTGSTQQNPIKAFASAGAYSITLTASRGSQSATSSQTISVGARTPILPPNVPYRSLVSAAAQSNGGGGSVWRTELTLFNAGAEPVSVDVTFLPGAGSGMQTRSVFLSARQSRTFANALSDIFGISNGSGALAIEATSPATSPVIRVSSRTFNNGTSGTYGQGIPDVMTDDLQKSLFLTGIASTDEFRTNIGLVNRSGGQVGATLTLLDPDGGVVGNANVLVSPNNFQQVSLATYFPTVSGRSLPSLSMQIATSAAEAVSAYASVIDNRTQDPVYIQAVPQRSGTSLTVPIVGRSQGANATFWRSDVTIFNPALSPQTFNFTLRPYGAVKSVRLAPRATVVIPDIVREMGYESGNGVLDVTWTSSAPVVTSRTYTSTTSGATFGQSIDPVEAFASELYVTGLRSDASFRSNVGLVNVRDGAIDVEVNLLNSFGALMGSSVVGVPARSVVQQSVASMFPNVDPMTVGSFTIQAKSAFPSLFVYGSIVDNASGDPVFFAGR